MNGFTKLALLLCLALTVSAVSHSAFATEIGAQILARLNALEKENAALRARVNRLEASKAAPIQHRPANLEPNPAVASLPRAEKVATDARYAVGARRLNAPRFEVSGSLLFLQPGAGNLEYGTLVNPLPAVSPHWNNQALKPNFSPAFGVGARYLINESNDIALSWTHLNTTTRASVFADPTQMVGPPYLIGPESALYKIAHGAVRSAYDSVNLDGGHTFCAECSFRLRVFAGVEIARIGQTLSGTFQSLDGTASHAYTNHSSFTGAGPRLGMKGQYGIGDFQFIGEVAAAALIGSADSRIDFTTTAPALAEPTNQYLASPKAMQVVPSINARLAAAYTFPPSDFGLFQIEAGYRAAVYFNAVSQYSMTQVPTGLMLPPNGIYLATAQRLHSNFTDQGPYVTGNWRF
jgi:major outer membrane protein